MATLHTNESRQLYVVNSIVADPTTIIDTSAAGTTAITGVTAVNSALGDAYGYVTQKGSDSIVRSDLVKEQDIMTIKHTAAADMVKPMQKWEVTLDPTINGGNPVAGQVYKVELYFRQWIGLSPENQYYKFGSVRAYEGMTPAQFYNAMLASLQMNFKREPLQVLNFSVDNTTTPTKLVIEEVEQPWRLGLSDANSSKVDVVVDTDMILLNGDYFKWGVVASVDPTTLIPNGKAIADMEYFYHGERGDVYRNVGWPNVWFTTYMVDPTLTYDTFDIVYNFEGANQESYFSRKVLTLVVPTASQAAVAAAVKAAWPNAPYVESTPAT